MQSETKSAIASAALHAGVLGFALLTFSGAARDATPPPSMPIDLVSTEEFSKLTKGAKDAPKTETSKPLVEKQGEEKPVEEQKPKPVEKKPDVQAARDPTPPPAEEKKPDPIAEKIKEEPKPVAEKPPEKKVELPPQKPQPPKPPQKQQKLNLDKVAAFLDKRDAVRETATGAEVNNNPSLGASQGAAARLSQSEIDAFRARMRECWQPPIAANGAVNTQVLFNVALKQDGSLARTPLVVAVRGAASTLGPVLAESAQRALLQCQPYKMFKPEHYEVWKEMEITFDPRDMLGG
jgi:colicin import membrane protein